MAKGPKGPRTKMEVLDRIIMLALDESKLIGKNILNKLLEEFPPEDVPGLRTVQIYVHDAREEATTNLQEQPWSLAIMAKADVGIPWEAASFLLTALDELGRLRDLDELGRLRDEEGEIIWRWSAHPLDDVYKGSPEEIAEALSSGREPERISVKPMAPRAPIGTVLTNRQAKWLWRIHCILPTWCLPEWLGDLCKRADEYAHLEMLADYLNEDFDTSDFDVSLMYVLRDIKDRGTPTKKKQERGKKT